MLTRIEAGRCSAAASMNIYDVDDESTWLDAAVSGIAVLCQLASPRPREASRAFQ